MARKDKFKKKQHRSPESDEAIKLKRRKREQKNKYRNTQDWYTEDEGDFDDPLQFIYSDAPDLNGSRRSA